MKICVFGLWHLGTVTAACLSKLGFDIIGFDSDTKVIDALNVGKAPLYEPGLDDLIAEGLNQGKLRFSTVPSEALSDVEFVWITFDILVDENDIADIGFIEKKIISILPYMKTGMKIIISSQVPVGFTKKIKEKIKNLYPDKKLYLAYSPENLRLGKAIKIFLEPDRIIFGTSSAEKVSFVSLFSAISNRLEWMSIESAEMTKHAINTFLASCVAFANEIATICEHVGASAKDVARGLKTDQRIGPRAYLNPGGAFSGGTLARDIEFLSKLGKNFKLPLPLIKSIKESNDYHKDWVKRKCIGHLGNLKGKKIAVLGLTYKPNTDTLRRSFSIELCKWLDKQGAKIKAFDPRIKKISSELSKKITIDHSVKNVIKGADSIIIATDLQIFRELDSETIKGMSDKTVIDPNGFLEEQLADCKNIRYIAVGRGKNEVKKP